MQNHEQIFLREERLNRRGFLTVGALSAAITGCPATARETSDDPWSEGELIQPIDLAKELASSCDSVLILSVTFPVLYRQKRLPHARLAGPANKPEGRVRLREAVRGLQPTKPIVFYCGCCPMKQCPNIRPAYRALKALKFEHLRVLNLPTNLHTDWIAKGYPVVA